MLFIHFILIFFIWQCVFYCMSVPLINKHLDLLMIIHFSCFLSEPPSIICTNYLYYWLSMHSHIFIQIIWQTFLHVFYNIHSILASPLCHLAKNSLLLQGLFRPLLYFTFLRVFKSDCQTKSIFMGFLILLLFIGNAFTFVIALPTLAKARQLNSK